MTDPERVLIAGFGRVGRRHLQNMRHLLPRAKITVWRQHTPVLPGCLPPPGADDVVGTLEQALATAPQAVIVAGPAPVHIETALAFARVGAHVFVEKPLADRLDGTRELITLCQRKRLVLMVGYVLRFSPTLNALHELLRAGTIGQIRSARIEVGQYLPDWRPGVNYRQGVSAQAKLGGGVLLELSHELHYAHWLLGEVTSVTCLAKRVSDLELDVEDVAEVLLSFRGAGGSAGPLASVHLDFLQRAASRTCQLIGAEGTLRADLIRQEVTLFSSGCPTGVNIPFTKACDVNELYLSQFAQFLECIRTGAAPAVGGVEGRRVLEIVLAAVRSWQTGMRQDLTSDGAAQSQDAAA